MKAVDIFIAYSHNDLTHKNELKKFLRPLLNTGQARMWDDHEIEGGQDWEAEIKKRLYGADIILLLVSPDSLASEYFYGQELKVSLERHDKGEAVVIPIIIRPCAWTITPLKRLEALPEKGKPVTSWPSQDEAYTDIAHKIGGIVENRQAMLATASEQETQRLAFAASVEAAEHLFYKKQWSEARKAFDSALQLYRPGFSPDYSTLENRMAACAVELQNMARVAEMETRRIEYESARTKNPAPPVADALPNHQPASSNTKLILLGVFTIVLLVLGVWFLTRPTGNNRQPDPEKMKETTTETIPSTYPADWRNAATIPDLRAWLENNPQADSKDRNGADQRLKSLLGSRKIHTVNAENAIRNKEYEKADQAIKEILKISPNDDNALQLRRKIPKY